VPTRQTSKALSIFFFFSLLNVWNVLYPSLFFLSFCSLSLFLFVFLFLFFAFTCYCTYFELSAHFSKHVSTQNAFTYKNMYTHK
jgi:hypothetical protein